ncbi:taste receptor type 2 member 19-like [Orycteropus afer afer]|uniref:Taste receptor type 2 n=1 Tax=Orycteropus afer afer TaxID=1230840 RepID=A0A8B7B095_ORYAF|nr:taste receptor type 2 member 19-like [Orycteropus afer afer]
MVSLLRIIISTIVMVEFVLGYFANSFITLVNCIDWIKRQKFSSADRILTALAISRIGLLWVILINWYLLLFNPVLYRLKIRTFNIAWFVINHFSIWLTTCLSIFYLLKIANFSSLIFFHLKQRVERVLQVVLLGMLVILGFQLALVITDYCLWMNDYKGNMTWKIKLSDSVHLSDKIVFTLGIFIPFIMSLASFLLLLSSLVKHHKKLQFNGKGSHGASTKAHVKAMQTVTSFLLLFAIYSLALIASAWGSNKLQNNLIFELCQAIAIIYPSNHSFILILVNQKLRQTFLSLLWQLRCWLKEKETLNSIN